MKVIDENALSSEEKLLWEGFKAGFFQKMRNIYVNFNSKRAEEDCWSDFNLHFIPKRIKEKQ